MSVLLSEHDWSGRAECCHGPRDVDGHHSRNALDAEARRREPRAAHAALRSPCRANRAPARLACTASYAAPASATSHSKVSRASARVVDLIARVTRAPPARRATAITCAPRFAYSTASARPMPLEAPVMRTVPGTFLFLAMAYRPMITRASTIRQRSCTTVMPASARRFGEGIVADALAGATRFSASPRGCPV